MDRSHHLGPNWVLQTRLKLRHMQLLGCTRECAGSVHGEKGAEKVYVGHG